MTQTTIIDAHTGHVEQQAIGGGLEGAERTNRETAMWDVAIKSPDTQIMGGVKEMADARGLDMVQNDGFAMGVVNLNKDSIVGAEYRLNAQPEYTVLGASPEWAEEFQELAEARFNLMANSPECWFDASRMNTFTGLIRLAVAGFVFTGESLSTAEWIDEPGRPFKTAIQKISPSRLSNPDGMMDTPFLRRGVAKNMYGAPIGYHIRKTHPGDIVNYFERFEWQYLPAVKPWGRRQVIHIIEQLQPGQTRGVADMVAVLKEMRMTKTFQEVTLQNAVVNASYAAAIESELPQHVVQAQLGVGQKTYEEMIGGFMTALQSYVGAAGAIKMDGVKIPHLFPGTKLNLKPMGTPGGIGTDFEKSLQRHVAAALGLSYEQFSRDYTDTNYSSARASMAETRKYMASRKKTVADREASAIYVLWLEEELSRGNLPFPPGMTLNDWVNDPVKREALSACSWIGASSGQIDEKKETEAAIMRIQNNLSTLEEECAKLGSDWRKILRQRAREIGLMGKLGVPQTVAKTSTKVTEVEEEEDPL